MRFHSTHFPKNHSHGIYLAPESNFTERGQPFGDYLPKYKVDHAVAAMREVGDVLKKMLERQGDVGTIGTTTRRKTEGTLNEGK